jgi:hypothetical protein
VIEKVFEWLFAAILVCVLLPCIVSIVLHTLGPALVTVGIVAVIIGVYRSYNRARSQMSKSRSSAGSERTPILPRGND